MIFPLISVAILHVSSVFSAPPSNTRINNALFRLSLNVLKETPNRTAVVSPFAIGLTLAAINAGAGGNTSQELVDVVFGGSAIAEINQWFNQTLNDLESEIASNRCALTSALFVDNKITLLDEYSTIIADILKAEIEKVDFSLNPQAQRSKINEFVNTSTHGTIPELVLNGQINSKTQILPVNTLTLKSLFRDPFYDARIEQFEQEDGTTREVELMTRRTKGHFHLADHYVYASFPFQNSKMDFFIVVSRDESSLPALMGQFLNSTYDITAARARRKYIQDLYVTMPKLNVNTRIELSGLLRRLGVASLFEERGDLSGISEEKATIDLLVHQASLEITEEGASVAASPRRRDDDEDLKPCFFGCERHVYADKPFLFGVLKDNIPLFVGQFY